MILIYGVFVWLLTAWEALLQLSGGMVRRIESEDRHLARRAEHWMENQSEYDVLFRILCFALIGAMSIILIDTFRNFESFREREVLPAVVCAAIVLCCVVTAEAFVRLALDRFHIMVLKTTMPFMTALRLSLFAPVVLMLRRVSAELERPDKDKNAHERPTAEDEIMSLVEMDDDEGGESELEDDEKRMIKGIFDLDNTPVREIMTPRVDVVAMSITATVAEAKRLILESGHSRIPVYKDSIDEIAGIIYAKDFLDEERCAKDDLYAFAHKAVYIPETKNVGDMLEDFKRRSYHFAVIIDEYGGTSGIITLEDIIEEIVGEIRDEYDTDEEEESPPSRLEDGSYILDGRYLICDLNELLDLDIPDEDVDTIGGYICGEAGRIPEAGEELSIHDGLSVRILKADRRKILTVSVKALNQKD